MCLANARLILPDRVMRGAVHVADGRVVDITEGDQVPSGATDLEGDLLLPGFVELHTDNLERHIEPRPGVQMPHGSAILAHDGELASCGITTVFDALRVGSAAGTSTGFGEYARAVATEILDLRAAKMLKVRHLIHLRAEICSDSLISEFDAFGPEDRVGLVSMMDHTPGQRQFRDLDKLREYYTGKYAMSEVEFVAHIAVQHELRARVGDAHEQAIVAAAARLGAPLASHDDTTAEQVAHSARQGIRLAEFPTTVEAAEACRDAGQQIIMGAPNLVRGGSHSGNVSAGDLAERGLLDIVSSDYVPSLLVGSVVRLARLWDDLPRAVATVTAAPADAARLADRGRIANGALADLQRVHLLGELPVIRTVWRGGVQIA
ncbi:alpha-D-ribose 1-methylphosphonate 5-triphosphate diphosphatase [Rhodobacteraceae bacterium KN286]|uniref:Alpha-D-ribose 1-methylphosphonate 5-triphosphate diphosphatase n=2 Tax=Oceanomicrobium pacificus TaxID=2692916 RepID=A0A6B0TY59_9RHOB|nr:alpha-D-ribose 1-methylphosphonate 5-triphosphate diphosphatase [Oceanomicrobium pacificus]MXU63851.1 alpha-D-ribose 1-methylphosphonate 5-triphosphate diphosphatase [Oceanomicrobium pacificus]